MTSKKMAKELGIRRLGSRRPVRVGATALGLTVVLMCGAASPGWAAPDESRQVHVEGHLLPVEESPGTSRITGGLVGTYKLRTERVVNAWTYWGTQIREIVGSASIDGCVDQNQNATCDTGEPSGEFRLIFSRVAGFDVSTGRMIERNSAHQVIGSGPFSGGVLNMHDIPVGNGDEIVSSYEGNLQIMGASGDSVRAN
jgi:hypothetical protein